MLYWCLLTTADQWPTEHKQDGCEWVMPWVKRAWGGVLCPPPAGSINVYLYLSLVDCLQHVDSSLSFDSSETAFNACFTDTVDLRQPSLS